MTKDQALDIVCGSLLGFLHAHDCIIDEVRLEDLYALYVLGFIELWELPDEISNKLKRTYTI